MICVAHSAARSSTRSGATEVTTRPRMTRTTNSRIIRAASSCAATLRISAVSGPPPDGSHTDRNIRTTRSPSCSGGPGRIRASRASGSIGKSSVARNKASLPPNQWLTIAGSTPARSAITRTVAPS
jgi:hypothetical protein